MILSLIQLLLVILYVNSSIPASVFTTQLIWMNFAAPMAVCIVMMFISYTFSGSPIRSKAFGLKLNAVKYAVMIWSVARILRGIGGMWEDRLYQALLTIGRTSALMILITGFVVIEIIPFLFVLDWRFMETFLWDSFPDRDLTEPLYFP
jgi:hypothetical protein